MKASEWIDRVKKERGWDSDYRASKELGLSRNAVSNYRSGMRSTLDDDVALKVADLLGEPPEIILLDQAAERTKSAGAKSALGRVLKQIGGAAATILLATGLAPFPNGGAGLAQASVSETPYTSYRSKKRRKSATWCTGLGAMAMA